MLATRMIKIGGFMRDRAYRRLVRNTVIKRKKTICRNVYHLDSWYSFDGQYSKGKIHCGCGICKYGKKYGMPTVKTMRELEKFKCELLEVAV